MKLFVAIVDNEYSATRWWDGGGKKLFASVEGRQMTFAEVFSFCVAAGKIPGWANGPDANHPIIFKEIDR